MGNYVPKYATFAKGFPACSLASGLMEISTTAAMHA
jgi:hypothetical protein